MAGSQLTQNKSTRRNENACVISASQQLSGTTYEPDDESESDGTHHSTQSHSYSLPELRNATIPDTHQPSLLTNVTFSDIAREARAHQRRQLEAADSSANSRDSSSVHRKTPSVSAGQNTLVFTASLYFLKQATNET